MESESEATKLLAELIDGATPVEEEWGEDIDPAGGIRDSLILRRSRIEGETEGEGGEGERNDDVEDAGRGEAHIDERDDLGEGFEFLEFLAYGPRDSLVLNRRRLGAAAVARQM